MPILNSIPLVGIILGLFLLFIAISGRNGYIRNKTSRFILLLIILFNTYYQLDSYLFFNGYDQLSWLGISYTYYHLLGALVYLFTCSLFNLNSKLRFWLVVLSAYTIIRILFLINMPDDIEILDEDSLNALLLMIDYLISIVVNIIFLFLAFFKLRKMKFAVQLTQIETIHYKWMYRLIIISIIMFIAIIQSDLISYYNDIPLILQFKIDASITSIFLFALAFFAIKFPVFAIKGDYNELPVNRQSKKYAKSTLKQNESDELWKKIQSIMEIDKPYQNPEFRLNDLAKLTDNNLHHVSQVINEKKQLNFFDFVNKYRVNDAKKMLLSDKAKQYTILAIAFEVGFNSKTTFYNAFKKEMGITPSVFKMGQNQD